jgi:3-methyladenine DNA glycosylase/8-oxoguanine DNA glycosylase
MKAKPAASASSSAKTSPRSDRTVTDRTIIRAERHLSRVDPVMKRLIEKHGRCLLAPREFQPFHMLTNSIISQQLSSRAAFTIKQRLAAIVASPFDHTAFLTIPLEALRAAGLSQAKARYIGELASRRSPDKRRRGDHLRIDRIAGNRSLDRSDVFDIRA